jgi:hypothetical protein
MRPLALYFKANASTFARRPQAAIHEARMSIQQGMKRRFLRRWSGLSFDAFHSSALLRRKRRARRLSGVARDSTNERNAPISIASSAVPGRALTAERLWRCKIAGAPACYWLETKLLYPYPSTDDPKHWRELARGARRVAEIMLDARARGHMTARAEAYERLAFRAERGPTYAKPQANDP